MPRPTMEELKPIMASRQTLFDYVARHLIMQGVQAKTTDGNCMYRGPNDTSCAVGCVLPDSAYSRALEGYSAKDLYTAVRLDVEAANAREVKRWELLATGVIGWLRDLQFLHDNTDPREWVEALTGYAKTHDLDLDAVRKAVDDRAGLDMVNRDRAQQDLPPRGWESV